MSHQERSADERIGALELAIVLLARTLIRDEEALSRYFASCASQSHPALTGSRVTVVDPKPTPVSVGAPIPATPADPRWHVS